MKREKPHYLCFTIVGSFLLATGITNLFFFKEELGYILLGLSFIANLMGVIYGVRYQKSERVE